MVKRKGQTRKLVISKESKQLVCPCLDDIFFGVPCRHEVAVFLKADVPLKLLPFNNRWLLKNSPNEMLEDALHSETFKQENSVRLLYLMYII